MISWDIGDLSRKVVARHGETVGDRFQSAVQSFALKRDIVSYHCDEAKRIFQEAVEASIDARGQFGDAHSLLLAVFSNHETIPKWDSSGLAKLKVEAHSIAAAQAIHSMGDVMANACYCAMRLDLHSPAIDLNRLSLRCINKAAKKSSEFAHLNSAIEKLLSSSQWRYLNAYVNTTKHVSLAFSSLNASFDEDRGGIKFHAFDYKGTHYKEKWLDDLLEDLNSVYRLVGAVGLQPNSNYSERSAIRYSSTESTLNKGFVYPRLACRV